MARSIDSNCFTTPIPKHAIHWQDAFVLRVTALSLLFVSIFFTVLSKSWTLKDFLMAFQTPNTLIHCLMSLEIIEACSVYVYLFIYFFYLSYKRKHKTSNLLNKLAWFLTGRKTSKKLHHMEKALVCSDPSQAFFSLFVLSRPLILIWNVKVLLGFTLLYPLRVSSTVCSHWVRITNLGSYSDHMYLRVLVPVKCLQIKTHIFFFDIFDS